MQGIFGRAAALAVVGLAASLGLVATPEVLAVEPASTITLASGNSAHRQSVQPWVVTSTGLVFDSYEGGTTHVAANGTATVLPALPDQGCGTFTTFGWFDGTVDWLDVSNGATGSRSVGAGRHVAGPAPDGWLEQDDATYQLFHVVAATGASNPVGTLPGPHYAGGDFTCDATHFATTYRATPLTTVYVGTFASDSLATLVSSTDPAGSWVNYTVFANRGATVTFEYQLTETTNFTSVSELWRRAPGTPGELVATTSDYTETAAMTATDTWYVLRDQSTGDLTLYVKAVGGAVSVVPSTIEPWVSARLSATPSGVRLGVGGTVNQGMFSVARAGLTKVWTPPFAALYADSVVLSAGRATWSDDRDATGSVWSRSITGTTTLTAGAETLIGTHVSAFALGASGRRTAWAHDTSRELTVATTGASTVTVPRTGGPTMLRGHRVVQGTDPTSLVSSVTDLVTMTTTDVPSVFAVWGDTAYRVDYTAQTVTARNLSTGAETVVLTTEQFLAPAVASGHATTGAYLGSLSLQGDLLAWTIYFIGPDGNETGLGWRNLRTGASGGTPITALMDPGTVSVYGGYVVAGGWGFPQATTVYNAATGATVFSFTWNDQADAMTNPVLGPQGLGWTSWAGEPKVTPLPDQHLVPRHEGNPFAPTTFNTAGGGTWDGEWVFTEPLTTCTVAIKSPSGTTVRTLTCNSAYAAQGEAVVSWDGRDAAGAVVPTGTYTWQVNAADADGSVVDANGTSTTITGSITVSSVAGMMPITPSRLLDTRDGTGYTGAKPTAGQTVSLQVTGRGGVPATGVEAVILNVTAVQPVAGGFVTVFPTGTSRPTASNLNYVAGDIIPNQVIAKVGTGGKVELYTHSSTHLLADVTGYFATGAPYTGFTPQRLVDTRLGTGAPKAKLAAGGSLTVPVVGVAGVPASGVGSVVLNVTAVEPTAGGFLTIHPTGTTRPDASNINYVATQIIAGMAVAKVGSGGSVTIYSLSPTDVVVDIAGWFPTTSDFNGLTPARLLDTRQGAGTRTNPATPITLQVTGRGGVPATGVKAVVLNIVSTDSLIGGFVTAYPADPRPTASVVNYAAKQTIANSVTVKLAPDGTVKLYTHTPTHLVVDVQGWYSS